MSVLIPEAWRPKDPAAQEAGQRQPRSPQPQRGRWLSLFLGLLPLVMGTGAAFLVSMNRHM